jgi:hypothetical protein
MFEADDGHGYSAPRRQAAYRWLGRWLKGREDLEAEQPESPEDLRCTESGQVAVSLGGETVTSLNLKRVEQGKPARTPLSSASRPIVARSGPPLTPCPSPARGEGGVQSDYIRDKWVIRARGERRLGSMRGRCYTPTRPTPIEAASSTR